MKHEITVSQSDGFFLPPNTVVLSLDQLKKQTKFGGLRVKTRPWKYFGGFDAVALSREDHSMGRNFGIRICVNGKMA